ncbi:hypothetical protein WJX72_010627 [[Myrmecia] bisecta]|uniref:Uncharacterized protein n=1 Tax=[Myrmecia] bisecta TaxID=41462 RepID=A0AAW1QSK2_9CHLO
MRLVCKGWCLAVTSAHGLHLAPLVCGVALRFRYLASLDLQSRNASHRMDAKEAAGLTDLPLLETLQLSGAYPAWLEQALAAAAESASLTSLHLQGATNASLPAAARFPRRLRNLALKQLSIPCDPGLSRCVALCVLDLEGCCLWDTAAISSIASIHSLTLLNLSGCLPELDIEGLSSLVCLTDLNVGFSGATDQGLATMAASCTALTALRLPGCSRFSHGLAASTEPLSRLRLLDVSGCNGLHCHPVLIGHDLDGLQHLTSLTDIQMDYGRYKGLAGIMFQLTQLTRLSLKDCCPLGNMDLAFITTPPALQDLAITSCSGLARLSSSLRALNLAQNSQLETTAVEHITQRCPALRCLNLAGLRVLDDAAVPQLTALSHLTSLNLSRCAEAVTDSVLITLAPHGGQIARLNLADCTQFGYRGLQALAQLTALTDLDLTCCRQLADAAVLSMLGSTGAQLHLSGGGMSPLASPHQLAPMSMEPPGSSSSAPSVRASVQRRLEY